MPDYPLRIFIGYDPREASAYHVCQQSIIEHAKDKNRLQFHPVCGERRDGSNDFIYARFLVPYVCQFMGQALFIDGDMIVRTDIAELFDQNELGFKGVRVVKHNYKTKYPSKYLDNKNEDYPRKNWSSVILWNCSYWPNRTLTPEVVANATGDYLHRFMWLQDHEIGELPREWNRLVLEEPMTQQDKLRHYTIGTPCFPEYADTDQEWWDVYSRMIAPIKG